MVHVNKRKPISTGGKRSDRIPTVVAPVEKAHKPKLQETKPLEEYFEEKVTDKKEETTEKKKK